MFWFLIIGGVILYFVLRGKSDPRGVQGAPKRALGSGPLEPVTFTCPYTKCQACGASAEKMKQEWDGLRSVRWTCGFCGSAAGIQELRDEELPASARRRLGLDPSPLGPGVQRGGGFGMQTGGGAGDLLTGLMLGSMMGGGHRASGAPRDGEWGGDASGSSDGSWGDSGNASWGDDGGSSSGGGSDWGDSGGGGSDWGDSGGGDSGGGDSGGDW